MSTVEKHVLLFDIFGAFLQKKFPVWVLILIPCLFLGPIFFPCWKNEVKMYIIVKYFPAIDKASKRNNILDEIQSKFFYNKIIFIDIIFSNQSTIVNHNFRLRYFNFYDT